MDSSSLPSHEAASVRAASSYRLAWMLAQSHLRRRKLQNLLTILGIAVGMMALIAALSLTNGFTRALVDATLQATPHLTLLSGKPSPPNRAFEQQLKNNPEVVAYSAFVADKGLLTRPATAYSNAGVDFVTLFGLDAAGAQVLRLPPVQQEQLAALKDGEVLLGSALSRNIGAFLGDQLNLLSSSQQRSRLKVVGSFSTGNYLIDSAYGFTTLATLQRLSASGKSNITGYQVRLQDPDQAIAVGKALTEGGERGAKFQPFAWQQMYGTLLDQLALQKKVIAFVVFLIVVVAAFGIANVLTLIVFEKTQEIAILRAIGMTQHTITLTFVIEGLLLGLGGLLLGNALGLGVSAYFMWRPFELPGDLYFITSLPVEVRASDIAWVNAVALMTTILAAFMPARRAASVEPARIIR